MYTFQLQNILRFADRTMKSKLVKKGSSYIGQPDHVQGKARQVYDTARDMVGSHSCKLQACLIY